LTEAKPDWPTRIGQAYKGNRDAIEGKYFWGFGDIFLPDGAPNRRFDTLWWQCGRYLELLVQTADEPLTLGPLTLRETRYPLEMESAFACSEPAINRILPIMVRAMQMCSHEIYMDCPFFEQCMYVGDTRLEILTTFAMTHDDRLPRKALRIFDVSRIKHAFVQIRYPTHAYSLCPPYSLIWVAMVRDFALWRDDPAFVRSLMPGVRATLDGFLTHFTNAEGLVDLRGRFNFMDWISSWPGNAPPSTATDVSALINWQMALVWSHVADLEEYLGESELAARARRMAAQLADRINALFWDEARGLYAEDREHTLYSEHAQCLAILSGLLDPARQARVGQGLLSAPDLVRTTIYFTHYLFEAYRLIGASDAFFARLDLWYDLERRGFKTTYEFPEPTRSDCHAWGAHPLYHCFATILGIRPASMGFQSVSIAPQLGPLKHASGRLPHPKGWIEADLRMENGALTGRISLPEGLTGAFTANGRTIALKPGEQNV
jgi:hypothetical protein